MEQQENIKFCYKLGFSVKKTYLLMQQAYGVCSLSIQQIYEHYLTFEREEGVVRFNLILDDKKINLGSLYRILSIDSNLTLKMLVAEFGGSNKEIFNILFHNLKKQNMYNRFVPISLTEDQKMTRVHYCRDIFERYKTDSTFLKNIIIGGEMCYISNISPLPNVQCSGALRIGQRLKTVVICFYTYEKIIYCDFVSADKIIDGDYYVQVLINMWKSLCEGVDDELPDDIFLLHDCTPAHRAVAVRQFLAENGIVAIEHPPYSPDLAPYNHVFSALNLTVGCGPFNNVVEMNTWIIINLLAKLKKKVLEDSIRALLIRAVECIKTGGNYVRLKIEL